MTARIGARELRQNLSAVLERVKKGERIVITSRNRPVAELGPLGGRGGTLAQLIAEGKATRAKHGPPHTFKPVKVDLGSPTALSDALLKQRDEESH